MLADALTSVLAIAALLAARRFGWNWLDPAAGIVGAGLILSWSVSLLKETSAILLEREMDSPLVEAVRARMEEDGETRVSDIHLWKVAQEKYACIISVDHGQDLPAGRLQGPAAGPRRHRPCDHRAESVRSAGYFGPIRAARKR